MHIRDCHIGATVETIIDFTPVQFLVVDRIDAGQRIPHPARELDYVPQYTDALLIYRRNSFPTIMEQDRWFLKKSASAEHMLILEEDADKFEFTLVQ